MKKQTMVMQSTLMRCVFHIGDTFKDTTESTIEKLGEILGVGLSNEILIKVRELIEEKQENALEIFTHDHHHFADIIIESIAEEKDIFGDLVPAHMKVTYQNVSE